MEKYTQVQKEIADMARKIMLRNLEKHITIAELAQEIHVSQTQVKVSFNRVYGMPVFSYARKARMEAAAANAGQKSKRQRRLEARKLSATEADQTEAGTDEVEEEVPAE